MSLIYVTGISGSGKSTVCEQLGLQGYETHDGDDNLSAFYHNDTGLKVDRPTTAADRTPEWRAQHTWRMSREALLILKQRANTKPVYVCGVASNEEEYLDVFDKVFGLTIDEPTLRHRIATRENNDFGKSEHEMQTLLEWQQTTNDYYQKIGAHIIDATRPLNVIVAEILSQSG